MPQDKNITQMHKMGVVHHVSCRLCISGHPSCISSPFITRVVMMQVLRILDPSQEKRGPLGSAQNYLSSINPSNTALPSNPESLPELTSSQTRQNIHVECRWKQISETKAYVGRGNPKGMINDFVSYNTTVYTICWILYPHQGLLSSIFFSD